MNQETKKQKINSAYTRREFIKAGVLTVGAAALTVSGYATAQAAVKPSGLSLSMAGYNFDCTRSLIVLIILVLCALAPWSALKGIR